MGGKGFMGLMLAASILSLSATCGSTDSPLDSGDEDAERLILMSWNLQAFFDAEEIGSEYDEYKKSAGWTETKYRARMDRLAEAAHELVDGGPDLIAVQEIENAAALQALAAGPFAPYGYRWTAFAGESGGALGVGLLSRRPLSGIRVHAVGSPGLEAPRPILEACLESGGARLTVFVCHWKSKLGGEEETEGQRRSSAASLGRRLAEIARSDSNVGMLALGDLNENVDEFNRVKGRYPTALLPDSKEAAERITEYEDRKNGGVGFGGPRLVVSTLKPPVSSEIPEAVPVYSPWQDAVWPGSYYYKGGWETIDHALLAASLFDGTGWEYASFSVVDLPPFTDASGLPDGYDPSTGTGLSDHLPIIVELERH